MAKVNRTRLLFFLGLAGTLPFTEIMGRLALSISAPTRHSSTRSKNMPWTGSP